ncbi:hypothetical protein N9H81_01875 [bacterium]|nr:hypothetical protein [bacterium]
MCIEWFIPGLNLSPENKNKAEPKILDIKIRTPQEYKCIPKIGDPYPVLSPAATGQM